MYYKSEYPSPLGIIEIVCDNAHLKSLHLPGQMCFPDPAENLPHPLLSRTEGWLDRYFAGLAPEVSELPLGPEGTDFQRLVWQLLLEIPYGQSRTYGDLAADAARALGKEKMSAQAVGQAVGANPIAIVIPCHRCLGAGGRLTGYAGGLDLKRALLGLEQISYRE